MNKKILDQLVEFKNEFEKSIFMKKWFLVLEPNEEKLNKLNLDKERFWRKDFVFNQEESVADSADGELFVVDLAIRMKNQKTWVLPMHYINTLFIAFRQKGLKNIFNKVSIAEKDDFVISKTLSDEESSSLLEEYGTFLFRAGSFNISTISNEMIIDPIFLFREIESKLNEIAREYENHERRMAKHNSIRFLDGSVVRVQVDEFENSITQRKTFETFDRDEFILVESKLFPNKFLLSNTNVGQRAALVWSESESIPFEEVDFETFGDAANEIFAHANSISKEQEDNDWDD